MIALERALPSARPRLPTDEDDFIEQLIQDGWETDEASRKGDGRAA